MEELSKEEAAQLQTRKTKLKNALSRVKAIHEQGRLASKDKSKLFLFKGMYKELKPRLDEFNMTWDSLVEFGFLKDLSSTVPSENDNKTREAIDSYYWEACAIYEHFMNPTPIPPSVTAENSTVLNTALNDSRAVRARLPEINLPRFDGTFSDWPLFRDTYTSLIHDEPTLSCIEKYHFLLSCLKGPALTLVKGISISEETYSQAWNLLKENYDDKRRLATSYLKTIMNFEPFRNKPSASGLKHFLSTVIEAVASFNQLAIPQPHEFILLFLVLRCLDPQTRKEFERKQAREDFPTPDSLQDFIKAELRSLELSAEDMPTTSSSKTQAFNSRNSSPRHKPTHPHSSLFSGHNFGISSPRQSSIRPRSSLFSGQDSSYPLRPSQYGNRSGSSRSSDVTKTMHRHICPVCNSSHTLYQCVQFKASSPPDKLHYLRNWQGCTNCLSSKHKLSHCSSTRTCQRCGRKHYSWLHVSNADESRDSTASSQGVKSLPNPTTSAFGNTSVTGKVILGTALVEIEDRQGHFQSIRLVVDCGSQHSFITSQCVKRLGFEPRKIPLNISGIGKTPVAQTEGEVDCVLRSRYGGHNFSTTAVVIPDITGNLPYSPLPSEFRALTGAFQLADPTFWKPQPIDFLLGADLYIDILTGAPIQVQSTFPKLLPTLLGHIIAVRCAHNGRHLESSSSFFIRTNPESLQSTMDKFWQLEDVRKEIPLSIEEAACEDHFASTHYRLPSGRYVVALPFKDTVDQLHSPLRQVECRLKKLEHRLDHDPDMKTQYHAFMSEYLQLEHMSATDHRGQYHIPHHGVSKKDGDQMKLRVVFDASCKGSHGSLTCHLMTGPKLQKDICDIVLKFRLRKIVLVADIVKMYRQVLVRPQDRVFQHIIWRFNALEPAHEFQLNTVTYGISSSAFLAIRTLQQLAKDEGQAYPLASQALMNDVYVDDIVTGADTIDEALNLQSQLVQLLRKWCFELSKWKSNRQELLDAAQGGPAEAFFSLQPSDDLTGYKILGLQWMPSADLFTFEIQPPTAPPTKRGILSTIARIFDPMGYLAPVVFRAKTILQEVWLAKCDWDDVVHEHIRTRWESFGYHLSDLSHVRIPRHVSPREGQNFIIGFCDTSQRGYAAALYLHSRQLDSHHTYLLKAKTKLAPTKLTSIPRLELCASLLLTRLLQSCEDFISEINPEKIKLFTDSTVVLAWLSTPPNRRKAFVGHRVTEIMELTPSASWNHIDSASNPADCASRGLMPHELPGHSLWWSGPSWLSLPPSDWPSRYEVVTPTNLPELKDISTACLITASAPTLLEWMSHHSSYLKIIRTVAYVMRFIRACKRHPYETGFIKLQELHEARITCIKLIQKEHLPAVKSMQSSKPWNSFSPFVDPRGLIRVGGRLQNSQLPYDAKHPVILPRCNFTRLLINYYHRSFLHIGPNALQAQLQNQFHIASARRLIRYCVRRCVRCQRSKPKPQPPLMGNLPACRLQEGQVFQNVGIDLGGPFPIKESSRRKASLGKAYLCLFVCMVTKALHLEVVSNCSTEAFLAALSRFISRRGKPLNLYSDCGSNFIRAKSVLKELQHWYKNTETQKRISYFAAEKEINWHLIPPRAPHFGGLWEAGIKSAKSLLTKNLASTPLTFEELHTLFARIEAVLNSRPLCPLHEDSDVIDCLTPGHFLIGRALTAPPEKSLSDLKENTLGRWQLIHQRVQHIWSRWRLEYLNQLQQRRKWTTANPNLQEGDLVIVKDSNAPPATWPLARIIQTHPGNDGIVRVATIRTPHGVYKRPVVKLVPLLLPQECGDQ